MKISNVVHMTLLLASITVFLCATLFTPAHAQITENLGGGGYIVLGRSTSTMSCPAPGTR